MQDLIADYEGKIQIEKEIFRKKEHQYNNLVRKFSESQEKLIAYSNKQHEQNLSIVKLEHFLLEH